MLPRCRLEINHEPNFAPAEQGNGLTGMIERVAGLGGELTVTSSISGFKLTTFDEHELVLQSMKLGAQGYLRKDVSLESLIAAIDSVLAGELWVQPAITNHVRENTEFVQPQDSDIIEPLTNSEVQVLRLAAAGYSNNEIAEAIHKSSGTVRNLMSFVLAKLQVRDRTRAVLKAIEHGLI
jgi:DNA-binding NarL/FixJ family response regulator